MEKNTIISDYLGILNAKKYGTKLLIGCLMIVGVLFLLCSCSPRKTQKSKTVTNETVKTETAKLDSSKTTTVANSNIKILDSGESEEFIISPIDSSKEMVVSGKSYKNAVLKHSKSKHNTVVDKSENIVKTEQKAVKENSKSQSTKSVVAEMKVTDKKQFNFLSLWWLLLIIPVYLAWKKWGKYLTF